MRQKLKLPDRIQKNQTAQSQLASAAEINDDDFLSKEYFAKKMLSPDNHQKYAQ